jgi:uridine phosphorylase
MPVRLSPLKQPGADAVLVGDPRRAFVLGQALTVQPEMSHLARGLWGYGGVTEAGLPLTVQATGVGGPSAVAVISDLAGLGVRRIVRLGTCTGVAGGTRGAPAPGSAFLIEQALGFDGASRTLRHGSSDRGPSRGPGPEELRPDPELLDALRSTAPASSVASHDLVHRLDRPASGQQAAAPLRDLQTAATFAAAERLGMSAAAILIVAEDATGERLNESELEQRFEAVGHGVVAAIEALSAQV